MNGLVINSYFFPIDGYIKIHLLTLISSFIGDHKDNIQNR